MTSEELLAPISETEALRQQLLHAHRLSSVGELASSIAHEFNNILTTIINSAKLGSRNPDPAEKQLAFERVVKAGQRAAAIAGGMLGFARKSGTHRQHCDIARLVEEVLILTDKARTLQAPCPGRKRSSTRARWRGWYRGTSNRSW